ncbi:hypothetical protein Q1695_006249 [Nippostrongylus brasiliensis]|nr:hypothetical protein Q1695_006249 [Nippostrongylus brasiliensis]
MLVERWHKRLKHEFVSGKHSIRVDALVNLLIRAPASMEEDRAIKMARGLKAGRSRLLQHHASHTIAVQRYGNNREVVEVLGEGRWSLTDQYGCHHIKQTTCICDAKYNNHCTRCHACAYAFACDCVLDSVSGVSCPHVHAVIMLAPEGLLDFNFASDDELSIASEMEVVASESIGLSKLYEYEDDENDNDVAIEQDPDTPTNTDIMAAADTVCFIIHIDFHHF